MLKTCTHTHTHMYKHIQYIQTHKYETVSSSTNCKEEIWNNAVLYFWAISSRTRQTMVHSSRDQFDWFVGLFCVSEI